MIEYKSKVVDDFPEWKAMERLILNDYKTKKEEKRLIEIAKEWLPYPILSNNCGQAPWGNYIWTFCVAIEQELTWNFQEFKEGRDFGHNPTEPYRDANPYKEHARKRSWDCGYILGLYENHQE